MQVIDFMNQPAQPQSNLDNLDTSCTAVDLFIILIVFCTDVLLLSCRNLHVIYI